MIEVRALATHEQFTEAVQLQQKIWGFAEIDLLPVRLFVVATKVGGQAFGAYDGARMVGFCLAIPGLKAGGGYYLHSHMLGVADGYRDLGVGRRLKLAQRKDAVARGIQLLEWTFDPLELKNAYFNMERLGAIVRRYLPNQYGTTSSPLHGGLPTDRLVAEWWVSTPRVGSIVDGDAFDRPRATDRIAVPSNIAELRAQEPRQARAVQAEIGKRFQECFGQGLAVIGFEKTPEAGVYLIGKWESS
ncbi:MAG: acetyltransferase [Acidobacteria bacterium]|nr:acetyltransferase [Acidobacteriota bacterium]